MMKKSRSRTKRTTTKSVLRLPDLEQAKAAVSDGHAVVHREPCAAAFVSEGIVSLPTREKMAKCTGNRRWEVPMECGFCRMRRSNRFSDLTASEGFGCLL